jgi:hypothetical protein
VHEVLEQAPEGGGFDLDGFEVGVGNVGLSAGLRGDGLMLIGDNARPRL